MNLRGGVAHVGRQRGRSSGRSSWMSGQRRSKPGIAAMSATGQRVEQAYRGSVRNELPSIMGNGKEEGDEGSNEVCKGR